MISMAAANKALQADQYMLSCLLRTQGPHQLALSVEQGCQHIR